MRGEIIIVIILIHAINHLHSQPFIHYCVYNEGSYCIANEFISNSKFSAGNWNQSVLRLPQSAWNGLNLTCRSSKAIKWVLDVPLNVQIDYADARRTTVDVANDPGEQGTRFYLQLNLLLRGLNGPVRCQSFDNDEEYAEVFIDMFGKTLKFLGERDSINFYIARSKESAVIPCAAGGIKDGASMAKVELLITSQENKILNGVSESCLHCICQPSGTQLESGCSRPHSCPPGSIVCGPFRMTKRYWEDGGALTPSNATGTTGDARTHPNGNATGWEACAVDYACAASTVRNYMARHQRDCNGDGAITCEDLILIHHNGPQKCSVPNSFSEYKAGKHRFCIESISDERDITSQASFDPRIGFLLRSQIDFRSLYVCATAARDRQVTYGPLDPSNRVSSVIYCRPNSRSNFGGSITCSSEEGGGNVRNLELIVVPCISLNDCDLKIRPFAGLGKFVETEKKVVKRNPNGGETYTRPLTSEGIVGCLRILESNSLAGGSRFVRQIDHFFTGLDSNMYIASQPLIPTQALIQLSTMASTFERGGRRTFSCRVSTFLLFPSIQFAVIFANGRRTMLKAHEYESESSTETDGIEWEILGISAKQSAEAERYLHLTLSSGMKGVVCMAPWRNSTAWLEDTLLLTVTRPRLTWRIAAFGGTAAFIVTVLVAFIVFMIVKYRRVKRRLRDLTEEEIDAFHNGELSLAESVNSESVDVNRLGFPQKYRLSPDDFKLYHKEMLGEGQYGRCFKGDLQGRQVAIKMMKSNTDVENFKAFLKELKVMAYIDHHENIVHFIGAMVDRISERVCLVLMEFSPHGNLQNFLQKNAHSYSKIRSESSSSQQDEITLTYTDLVSFCAQIASGMEHLSHKKVIHGDLATRNILVFDSLVVKITDFGLSRKLYESLQYTKKNQAPLPWRWLALESLKYLQFSPASDVWAFGILAWEIFSLGQVPYSGLAWTNDFAEKIEKGYRLSRPTEATKEIYDLLLECWSNEPADRPSFTNIKQFFRRFLDGADYLDITKSTG